MSTVANLRPTFSKLMALVDRLGLRDFDVEVIRRRFIQPVDSIFTGPTSGGHYEDELIYSVTEYGGYRPTLTKANGKDFARGFSEDSEFILSTTREFSDTVIPGSGFNAKQESITVDTSGQTAFTLSLTPSDASLVEMFINGAKQEYGVDYSVSLAAVTYEGSLVLDSTDVVSFWYLTSSGTFTGNQETIAVDDPGQTSFRLAAVPRDSALVQMFINSVAQTNGTDFSVSGRDISYIGGLILATDDIVEAWYVPAGGGSDFAALEFQNSIAGDQIFYVVSGPGMDPNGTWFTKTSFEVTALTYRVGLKRISNG